MRLILLKTLMDKLPGVTAMNIETGEVVFYQTRICMLATGGAGRIYQSTTNAHINTGDGFGMALRAGITIYKIWKCGNFTPLESLEQELWLLKGVVEKVVILLIKMANVLWSAMRLV